MRLDELEDALQQLARSQPAVPDRAGLVRQRASQRRLAKVLAGGVVACAMLTGAVSLWHASGSNPPLNVASGPTTVTGEPTPTARDNPGFAGDVTCSGPSRSQLEVMPVSGGAATPEAEVNSFLAAAKLGLPKEGYVSSSGTGTSSPGQPDSRVFVHPTGSGHIDVRLTLIRLEDGWRVNSVLACPS
jgi:hypothetical protein